jgi:hypothetical protein
MQKNLQRHAFAASFMLAALTLPAIAQAHKSWLLPNATLASGRDSVVVIDAAVSEDLFEFERGLTLDQLVVTAPDGSAVPTENLSTARHRNSFEVKLSAPGTYRVSHTSEALSVSYKLGDETKRWRGKPEALVKDVPAEAQVLSVVLSRDRQETFVTREAPGPVAPVPAAVSNGLTLQPLTPVTDLSDGDSSRFVLMLDGKPLPGATVTVLRAGNRYRYKLGETTLATDAKGEFSVRWAEPGRYWLGASHGNTRPPEAAPGAPAPDRGTREQPLRRSGYNATFEVLPK